MKPLLAPLAVLVSLGALHACSSTPSTDSASRADSGADSAPAAEPGSTPYNGAAPAGTPYVAQPGDDRTPDDVVPNFEGLKFNAYPLHGIRPRIVEISVETIRLMSERAGNRPQIELAVRGAIEAALKRSNITVVSRSQNKLNFTVKDCRNVPDTAECVAIDAVFRSPKFELEVGGYSHNGVTNGEGQRSHVAGDLTRAYYGAINAVMERLNKQLEIVTSHQ